MVILAVVLALGLGIGSQVVQSVRAQQAEQRTAVLEAAQLEDRLIQARDYEALGNMQDSAYAGWKDWQSQTATGPTDFIPPRSSSAGGMLPWPWNTTTTRVLSISGTTTFDNLKVDGDTAQVDVTRRYAEGGASAQGPNLVVRQTEYFRYANAGWVRTGPPDTTWQVIHEVNLSHLVLYYPAGDEPVIAPIVNRLGQLSDRLCQEVSCAQGRPTLYLSANPLDLEASAPATSGAVVVHAPSPVLIGLPVDATGSQDNLYRLYGIQLAGAMLQRTTGGYAARWHPLLHWELSRLGLLEPVSANALQAAARRAVSTGINPLDTPRPRGDAAAWLALDFLTMPGIGVPISSLIDGQASVSPSEQLIDLTEARPAAWWGYLMKVAYVGASPDESNVLGKAAPPGPNADR